MIMKSFTYSIHVSYSVSQISFSMTHVYKLTSQVVPKVPSAKLSELYDLSPQRIVGSPVRAALVIFVQNFKVTQSETTHSLKKYI